jgi:ubiquinone/menaquinone biosynthesis C-methylase UbiE
LGEGDGRFLSQLLRVNNTAQIVVVDKSPNMLRLARARVNGSARVEFLEQDVAAYVSASSALEPAFDSIVALFFLDCLSEAELSQLIPQLSGKLAPNGVWYVSDFHLPRSRLPRLLARVWLRFLYLFFGYFTDILARELVIPDPYLAGAGCFKTREILQVAGLLRATEFRKVTPEQVSRGAAG